MNSLSARLSGLAVAGIGFSYLQSSREFRRDMARAKKDFRKLKH